MMPIQRVNLVSLESTIKEVLDNISKINSPDCVHIPSSQFPSGMEDIRLGDIFYLEGDVYALTTRQYLDSLPKNRKIAQLFQDKSKLFYPWKPEDFVTIKPA